MGVRRTGNKERFVFETDEERDVLEQARNYFVTSKLFFTVGCGYSNLRTSFSSRFSSLRNVRHNSDKSVASVSIETWENIQEYASRWKKGESYNPKTFVRPG